eukprot:9406273-Lingulodinium_polyedra.AAC.1
MVRAVRRVEQDRSHSPHGHPVWPRLKGAVGEEDRAPVVLQPDLPRPGVREVRPEVGQGPGELALDHQPPLPACARGAKGPEGVASEAAETQGPREEEAAAEPGHEVAGDRPRLCKRVDGGHDLLHACLAVPQHRDALPAPAQVEDGSKRLGALGEVAQGLQLPAEQVEEALHAVARIGREGLQLDD